LQETEARRVLVPCPQRHLGAPIAQPSIHQRLLATSIGVGLRIVTDVAQRLLVQYVLGAESEVSRLA